MFQLCVIRRSVLAVDLHMTVKLSLEGLLALRKQNPLEELRCYSFLNGFKACLDRKQRIA